MNMVEKVARASFACWRKSMDGIGAHLDKGRDFEDMNETEKDFAFLFARAAIAAMRDPPDQAMRNCVNDNSGAPYCADHSFLKEEWGTMIDTVLSDPL